MKYGNLRSVVNQFFFAGILAAGAGVLAGCAGTAVPPVIVEFDALTGVGIPASASIDGSAAVSLDGLCNTINAADLNQMVRDAAGDMLPAFVTITAIELTSVDMIATDGTFEAFTTATLQLDPDNGDPILLGSAEDVDGLGAEFSLTRNQPIDLLSELGDDCGAINFNLEGAGFLEGQEITFDTIVTMTIYAEFGVIGES